MEDNSGDIEQAKEFGFDHLELSTTRISSSDYLEIKESAFELGINLGLHAWEDLAQLGPDEGIAATTALISDVAQWE